MLFGKPACENIGFEGNGLCGLTPLAPGVKFHCD